MVELEGTDIQPSKKFKSRTFWLALLSVALIPTSWIVEFFMKVYMLRKIVEYGVEDSVQLERIIVSIPLSPIVTLATFAISVYGIRKAGREISTNLTLPVGQNATNRTQQPSN